VTGEKAAFGYGHSFWDEACRLRQRQWTIHEILARARELGYTDLTWHQINSGLKRAPADLFLPSRTARWMRIKFEALERQFNSYVAMRDLAQEALEKIAEIEEELLNPELTTSRRMYLEGHQKWWYERAFKWARECSEIAIMLQEPGLLGQRRGAPAFTPDSRPEDVTEVSFKLIDEFRAQLEQRAVDEYGRENIRPPVEEEAVVAASEADDEGG
jgi:hypothetical protein